MAQRLRAVLDRTPARAAFLLQARPQALTEAVEMLITRGDAIRRALSRQSYTDPADLGGYLDEGLP